MVLETAQKDWARVKLKNEVIFLLKMKLDSLNKATRNL